jgi:four helix bundle protein
MARTNFENLDVYRLAEDLSDRVWDVVSEWSHLAQDTVGKQLIRAADGIGANISEGAGRGTYRENGQFVNYARGSLYETKHWLRRAFRRRLLSQPQIEDLRIMIDELAPRLNAYLSSLRRRVSPARPSGRSAKPTNTTNH